MNAKSQRSLKCVEKMKAKPQRPLKCVEKTKAKPQRPLKCVEVLIPEQIKIEVWIRLDDRLDCLSCASTAYKNDKKLRKRQFSEFYNKIERPY